MGPGESGSRRVGGEGEVRRTITAALELVVCCAFLFGCPASHGVCRKTRVVGCSISRIMIERGLECVRTLGHGALGKHFYAGNVVPAQLIVGRIVTRGCFLYVLFSRDASRLEVLEATAAAEKRAIAELRRRSHADGGMSFKV